MTRVLQTIDSASDTRGGPVTVALELNTALSNLGCNSLIMTIRHRHELRTDHAGVLEEEQGRPFGKYGFSGRYLRRVLSISRDVDFLVIHGVYSFTTISSLICAALRSKPYLLIPHGSLKREAERHPVLKHIADEVYVKFLIRNAKAVFFASEKERRECRVPITTRCDEVTPFGVTALEGQVSSRDDRVLRVAYLGRVARVKRLDTLVRAVARVSAERSISCQIIGPVDEVVGSALKVLAKELGVSESIVFVETVPRSEVGNILVNADVLVLASESENFGLAAVEALAAGLAIIVTEQVGMLEFLAASSIVRSFQVGDYVALSSELLRIDLSEAARSERRKSAKEIASDVFSWETYARRVFGVMAARC